MATTVVQKYALHIVLLLVSCSSVALACHGQLLASGITEQEKRIIMQEHNKLRQLVATGRYPGQPAAENMREIVWDDELAAHAQKWADNCQFRHDPLRTINRFTMGQNLAIIWSTAPLTASDGDFPSRIQAWFNEVQKYSFGDAWSPKTGHYSQLVWGETSLIGCGFSEYLDGSKYNKLYVCNYGPGGNVVGYKPYEVGKPSCGSYGMRPSPRYQGLCAAPTSSASGIFSNTIETYEYKQTNAFNSKQTAFSTQFPQPAPSSSKPYPQQAPSLSQAPSRTTAGVPSGTAAATGYDGVSATAYGVRAQTTAHATETGHYRYRHKLEAYKPSPAEFQKSVSKHTILRTYINQSSNYNQQQQQQQQEPQEQQEQSEEEQPIPAPTPKRGWSLSTWRG